MIKLETQEGEYVVSDSNYDSGTHLSFSVGIATEDLSLIHI